MNKMGKKQMKIWYGWVNGVFKGQCNANNVSFV